MAWLAWGVGFELSDVGRRTGLQQEYLRLVDDLAYDEELRQRYGRSGVDAMLLTYAITDPRTPRRRVHRRRTSPSEWGATGAGGMIVHLSFPDRPELGLEALDAYLAVEIRRVLEDSR
jgi:hypothetical protein